MKTSRLIVVIASMVMACGVKAQTIDFQGAENIYDMMAIYGQTGNAHLPDSTKGAINKEIERTFKLWAPRLYPTGEFGVAQEAIKNVANEALLNTTTCNNNYESVEWEEVGPVGLPIYGGTTTTGVGRIQRIEFDPQYNGTTNQTIYGSSEHAGLWRSENGGNFWEQVNTDLGIPFTSVSGIAINPNNSNHIFISTGLADVSLNLSTSNNSVWVNPIWTVGVYRSIDYGQNWEPVNNGLLDQFNNPGAIRNLKMHPTNGQKLYAATSEGFFKTANALATNPSWSNSSTGIVDVTELRGLCFKPDNASTIYTSGRDIYKSTDDGDNWVSMTGPTTGLNLNDLPDDFEVHRINIAVTPANAELLYAYIVGQYNFEDSKYTRAYVYKFDGVAWSEIESFTNMSLTTNGDPVVNGSDVVSSGWIAIDVSPVEEDFVVFGHTKLRGRRASNTSFQSLTPWYNGQGFHPDVHDIKFSPVGVNPEIYVAHHGGVSKGVVGTTGLNFSYNFLYDGLGTSTIWTFDVSDGREEGIIIGTQDNGSTYLDGYETDWKQIGNGDGYYVAISDIFNPTVYYRLSSDRLKKRSMFPLSGSTLSPNTQIPQSLEYGIAARIPHSYPNTHVSLTGKNYFGFTNIYERLKLEEPGDDWSDVWKYSSDIGLIPIFNNEGESWNQDWRHPISVLTVSQRNPNIVIAAVGGVDMGPDNPPFVKPALLKSETGFNEGVLDTQNPKFFDITPNLPTIPETGLAPVITGVAIDPYDENHLWISFTGYYEELKVWESFDGGDTWLNADPEGSLYNLPVNGIAIQNGTHNGAGESRIFIATDAGVYYKEPNDDCWMKYGLIPNVRVSQIKLKECENTIYAATYGRGVWKAQLPAQFSALAEIEIVENTTWVDERFFTSSIRVKSGNKLTIKSELHMPENGRIIVEKNAELIVDGGIITSGCGVFWQGIEVLGSPYQPQLAQYQGSVIMRNGGTIENAILGVSLGIRNENGTPDLSTTGGYLICSTGATFLNCKQAVQAYDYSGAFSNKTKFYNTTFEINDDWLFEEEIPWYQVVLRGVNNIKFQNCDFINNRTDEFSIYDAGKGIAASNTGFHVTNCNFENLELGITVRSLGFDDIKISENTFTGNLGGVSLRYSGLAEVVQNDFNIPAISDLNLGSSHPEAVAFGVYLGGSTGYEVEENVFVGTERDQNVGVAVQSSGPQPNEIYKNRFENLAVGIVAMGNNRGPGTNMGLRFRCDSLGTFDQPLTNSIALTNEGEVQHYQGSITIAEGGAGNMFYPLCAPFSQEREFYVGDDTPIESTVTYVPFAQDFTRPDCNTQTMVGVTLSQDEFIYEEHCPSNLSSSGSTGVSKWEFLQNKSMLTVLSDVYGNTVNGGDTKFLLDLIDDPFVSSFDLRNELLLASPRVTDEVMIAAIRRDPEMNHWHLAQVLLANSPLTQRVLNVLDQSDVDPYYRELIEDGQNGGMTNTTLMEMELSHFGGEMQRTLADYARQAYRQDSTMALNDSIIYYLSDEAIDDGLRMLLSYHIKRQQWNEAQDLLGNAPNMRWHNDFTEAMTILIEALQDSSGADAYIASNESALLAIANDNHREAYLARAILATYDIAEFEYPIVLPTPTPKSMKQNKEKDRVKVNPVASVHPNPAKNAAYLTWRLPEEIAAENVVLSVYNAQGAVVRTTRLNGQVGIEEINLTNWPSGLYIYQLRHDEILLHSGKFEVLR